MEDHKGNNGAPGRLTLTNLRFTWYLAKSSKVNLSIGLGCVISVTTTKTKSYLLKGEGNSLVVLTRFNNSRFEFVFTTESDKTKRVLDTLQGLLRAYQGSRLYREVKLRGVIFADKQKLRLLEDEEVHSKTNGVWNLSGEAGNLGTFVITNVRVVWYANLAPAFNVSIPFIQIKNIRVKNSKFGTALVLDIYRQ